MRYDSVMQAALQYLLSRPENGDAWPNFDIPPLAANRYPAHWPYHSKLADQQQVVCGMGTPSSCQIWFYWARYGQYLLQVSSYTPGEGMDVVMFAQIVRIVDTHVRSVLS